MGPREPKELHQPEWISSRLVECERGQSGEWVHSDQLGPLGGQWEALVRFYGGYQ